LLRNGVQDLRRGHEASVCRGRTENAKDKIRFVSCGYSTIKVVRDSGAKDDRIPCREGITAMLI
jgi:hypothetical protein